VKTSDLYGAVTNGIIAQLEAGTIPWTQPWKNTRDVHGSIMPHNFATGRAYSGINIPILWGRASAAGYEQHSWLTYQQAQTAGGQVRKGEKACTVVFTKKLAFREEESDKERKVSMLRQFFVFNVAQIDGLALRSGTPEVVKPEAREAITEAFIERTKAEIRHGGNRACYVPSADFVALPAFTSFKTAQNYYAVALHELGHWTGSKKRLDRELDGRFGTRKYAAEELIAELTAAFLCAHLGITGELRHAEYIANWIELLKHDDRAIFTAASKASQAADYLRSFSEAVQEEAA
jgi:antirestriction protein ArdC